MVIPDYALFRCGQLLKAKEYRQMGGDKLELWSGVLFDPPPAFCWPPAAAFTRGRMLSEVEYQTLSVPQGWQTELYRGVVLAWTVAEADASDIDLEHYRQQARHWIDKQEWLHVSPDMEDQAK
jgi:hypothetical protein